MLTADLADLGNQIALLEQTDVKLLHFDVMDGSFCPMLTVGAPIIKPIKTPLYKDVHLMMVDPLPLLSDFVGAGADIITAHVESSIHIHRVLQAVGQMTNANDPERGIIRGIALNPGTPVETIEPLLDEVDFITLLAVNPGWSGQKFAQSTVRKLAKVRRMIEGRDILLGLDGGITKDNISEIAKLGADIVVTGSAVFDGKAPVENASYMLNALCAHYETESSLP